MTCLWPIVHAVWITALVVTVVIGLWAKGVIQEERRDAMNILKRTALKDRHCG